MNIPNISSPNISQAPLFDSAISAETKIHRTVVNIFAILALIPGIVALGLTITSVVVSEMAFIAIPLMALGGFLFWVASNIYDYNDPEECAAIRETVRRTWAQEVPYSLLFDDQHPYPTGRDLEDPWTFTKLYQTHGLSNLIQRQILSPAELREKFIIEIRARIQDESRRLNVEDFLNLYNLDEMVVHQILTPLEGRWIKGFLMEVSYRLTINATTGRDSVFRHNTMVYDVMLRRNQYHSDSSIEKACEQWPQGFERFYHHPFTITPEYLNFRSSFVTP